MRRLLADTTALVVFQTLGAGAIELLVVGLSFGQMVQTRGLAIPAALLTARPYGLLRDAAKRRLGGEAGGALRRAAIDIGTFTAFNLPVYAGLLVLAGATLGQIAVAGLSAVVVMAGCGQPYGLFLEACRRLFEVPGSARPADTRRRAVI